MNHQTHTIIWQKWADPFGSDEEGLSQHLADVAAEVHDIEDEEKEELAEEYEQMISKKPIKVIATPMGIIPVSDNTASSKIFNFWVGHTNFNITKLVAQIIEETDGVESLDVFTRYRFRIAIGKAFNDSEIMRLINQRVYSHIEDNEYEN